VLILKSKTCRIPKIERITDFSSKNRRNKLIFLFKFL
jgi:hypothetical protein